MELKADIKCNRCKSYRYSTDFLNDKNRTMKCCRSCRDRAKKSSEKNQCEHNRRRNQCKECGGSQICPHDRHQKVCKECGGASICEHNRQRRVCKECGGASICEHNRQRSVCKECGGASICEHNRQRNQCKECGNAIEITIKNMINHSKHKDKKNNRYDADRFIDKCFLEGLVEEYPMCYYEDCNVELQYVDYKDNLATIERLDNSIGHIKSNCVLCCLKCNVMRKSNR